MTAPLIGITCHRLPAPSERSAVPQSYIDAVIHVGGAPICIPVGLDHEALHQVYKILDGLLLPGGDDVAPELYGQDRHPTVEGVDSRRDDMEITLARWAVQDDLPVLGICRGIQVLAVATGGTLYQDLPSDWESHLSHDVRDFGRDHLCHSVTVLPDTMLCFAIGCTQSRVNSFHHQAVRDVPPGFIVSARSEDGVIEAIESPQKRFALGVQSHPEGIWKTTAPEYRQLFASFIDAARNGHRARVR
jgi:putative glutamine amidotransferase